MHWLLLHRMQAAVLLAGCLLQLLPAVAGAAANRLALDPGSSVAFQVFTAAQ
jgi:hypothetical protein